MSNIKFKKHTHMAYRPNNRRRNESVVAVTIETILAGEFGCEKPPPPGNVNGTGGKIDKSRAPAAEAALSTKNSSGWETMPITTPMGVVLKKNIKNIFCEKPANICCKNDMFIQYTLIAGFQHPMIM